MASNHRDISSKRTVLPGCNDLVIVISPMRYTLQRITATITRALIQLTSETYLLILKVSL